jgi:hypothetical protein
LSYNASVVRLYDERRKKNTFRLKVKLKIVRLSVCFKQNETEWNGRFKTDGMPQPGK